MSAPDPLPRLLGALLLATERPLTAEAVADLINQAADEEEWPARTKPTEVEAAFRALTKTWDGRDGVVLARVGGGWRLRTAPDLAVMVRRLWPDRATRLSKAALEALAVVAYRQPCTRLDVEDVRGVDCGGVLRSLLDRKLLRIVGRKDEPGRPLLYGTTPEFLETFSLPDLRALPTLRDLESMRAEEAARAQGGPPGVEPAPALPDPEDLEAVETDDPAHEADEDAFGPDAAEPRDPAPADDPPDEST